MTFAGVSFADERLRVMIETDAPGGDPDDEGSLVRFFLYLNEWDVEGIYCTRRKDQSRNGESGLDCMHRFIDAYERVFPTLRRHDSRYPSPKYLRSITHPSYESNSARDAIVAAVDRDDPRRIWYVNWGTNDGNLTAMRHALDHVKKTRSESQYIAFADRLCFSRDADRSYHVSEHIPYLHRWIDTRDPDRWYHRFEPLTKSADGFNILRDVKRDHGPLGELYTIQKEGDTPGFLYLIPNGLSDVQVPNGGSWAGRFVPRTDQHQRERFYWSNAEDQLGDTTDRDNTLTHWVNHIQNDFRARMDWCVQDYSQANHPPVVVVNGADGQGWAHFSKAPSDTIELSAKGSTDPDEDKLTYKWFVYPEAGTYGQSVRISSAASASATITIPEEAAGKSIHVILQVTDDGTPALTRYRRVVLDVTQDHSTNEDRLGATSDSLPLWIAGDDGISLASLDTTTGRIAMKDEVSKRNATWLASLDRHHLVAGSTLVDASIKTDGAISTYRIRNDQTLQEISNVPSRGKTTIYVSGDPTGRAVFAANFRYDTYTSRGSVVAIAVEQSGKLGPLLQRFEHPGKGGSGSDRQFASHPHCIVLDPTGRYAAVADLGIDKVLIYRVLAQGRGLKLFTEIKALPGQQPRHLAWHPNGRFLYCMNEAHPTVSVIEFDAKSKTGAFIQHVNRLAKDKGSGGADIRIDSKGRFVYGSNRGENTIVSFAVNPDKGTLRPIGHTDSGGDSTRCIAISSDDKWLIAANQQSNCVTSFSIEQSTGKLLATPRSLPVNQPACVLFAPAQNDQPRAETKRLTPNEQQNLAKQLGEKVQRFEMWTDVDGNVTGLIFINHQALTKTAGEKPGIVDSDLRLLKQFPKLSAINFEAQPISDSGLQVLKEFPHLKQVGFHYMAKAEDANASPGFVSVIDGMRDLEILEIKHNFKMRAIHVQELATQFPKVWRLVLDTPLNADQTMHLIRKCPNVTDLQLHRTEVSPDQLKAIGELLPKLEILWLKPKRGVTSEHLAAIKTFPNLRIFSPQSFKQTIAYDSGWDALASMSALERLEIADSVREQNAEAIHQLQQQLPKLEIDSRLTRSRNYEGL